MRSGTGNFILLALVGAAVAGCVSVSVATAPPTTQPQPLPTVSATSGAPTMPPLPTFEMPTLPPLPTFELPTIDLPTFPSTSQPPSATPGPSQPSGEPTVTVSVGDTTYTAFGNPTCNYGLLDTDTWGVEYGDMSAGPDQVSSVRIIDAPDTTAAGERIVSVVIMVGNILSGGSTYILQGDRFTEPELDYEMVEAADGSAVAHASGQSMASPLSPGGQTVVVTVRCASVQR